MTGNIALTIALVSYGNCYINKLSNCEFKDTNSTINLYNKIKFLDYENNIESTIAGSINEWFKFLTVDKVNCLKLHYQSEEPEDRMLVAFIGGGGRWVIEAQKDNSSDYYQGFLKSTRSINKRSWAVNYLRIAKNSKQIRLYSSNLKKIKKILSEDLKNIYRFAIANKLSNFAKYFENGIECLNSDNPFTLDSVYHKDLVPDNYYSLIAQQILSACQSSWVFGGMGSWNDMSFEGKNKIIYEKVSEKLYKDISNSIVCAINSI